MVQLSHPYMTTGKTIALTIQTFVSKIMSLLFNPLSRFIIAFLPRSKRLLISWLQSPSVAILEPKKIKSDTLSTVSRSIWHEVMPFVATWMDLEIIVLSDCKEIQPVHLKGDQSWVFFGRTDAKAETPILWPPHAKSWLIGKDSDAGRRRGRQRMRWLDGYTDSMDMSLSELRSWWRIGRPDVLQFMGL